MDSLMLGFFKLIQPINDDIHANHERVRLLDKPCCIKNTLRLVVLHPIPTLSHFLYRDSLLSQVYLKVEKNEALHVNLLVSVAEYLTWLFKVFGVIPGSQHIGFPSEAAYIDLIS